MKTPMTPLEFMRRSRRLYPDQEAVVDGDLRLTYTQFFDRCDRWAEFVGVKHAIATAFRASTTRWQRSMA